MFHVKHIAFENIDSKSALIFHSNFGGFIVGRWKNYCMNFLIIGLAI